MSLCCSCNVSTDHKEEAQAIVLQVCAILDKVENGEQLASKSMHLKRLFNALADQMIIAASHSPTAVPTLSQAEREASEHLRMQINRVCSFSGGYEIMEKCQEEALHRLTTYSIKNATAHP